MGYYFARSNPHGREYRIGASSEAGRRRAPVSRVSSVFTLIALLLVRGFVASAHEAPRAAKREPARERRHVRSGESFVQFYQLPSR